MLAGVDVKGPGLLKVSPEPGAPCAVCRLESDFEVGVIAEQVQLHDAPAGGGCSLLAVDDAVEQVMYSHDPGIILYAETAAVEFGYAPCRDCLGKAHGLLVAFAVTVRPSPGQFQVE